MSSNVNLPRQVRGSAIFLCTSDLMPPHYGTICIRIRRPPLATRARDDASNVWFLGADTPIRIGIEQCGFTAE